MNSSDLVLAAGISFWTGVVDTHRLRDIKDCYQVITTLRDFLQRNKAEELTSNVEEGFKAEKLEGKISKEDKKGEVHDPVKPVEINTDDSDLDDLFEVLHPSDPSEEKIEEERKDSGGTEKSITENIVEVHPSTADIRVDGPSVEDKVNPEELTSEIREKEIKMEEKVDTQNIFEVKRKKTKPCLPTQCEYCKMIYPKFIDLKQHMSLDHHENMEDFEKKYKTYFCPQCPSKKYSQQRLTEHIKRTHGKNKKCNICDLAFYTMEELRRHKTIHKNQENKFLCNKCGNYFMRIERLKLHIATKKCKAKLLQCHECPKMVPKERLKKHLASHDDTLYCKTCTKRFLTKEKMMAHKAKCDLGQTKVKCRDCDLLFSSNNDRGRHEFRVHNINAKLCNVCGKNVKNGLYRLHMQSHSIEKLSCKHCQKTFKAQYHLEGHERRMHQLDSEKRYQCSYPNCTRGFTNRHSLESHMNCHLGLKPYQCDICETRFQNSSNKRAHMRNVHKFTNSSKNIQAI